MSCGLCGSARPPRRYKVTLNDGSEHLFLSETEARIYATSHGGGRIELVT
ncbi:hypothetical protein [Corynebacterium humireducens]|nr:hypothetical protein [Corynebacterium humireducens]